MKNNPHTNFAEQKYGNALASLGAIRPLHCEFLIDKSVIQFLIKIYMAKLVRDCLVFVY